MRLHISFSTTETIVIPLNHMPQVNEMVTSLLKDVNAKKHIKKLAADYDYDSASESEFTRVTDEYDEVPFTRKTRENYYVNSAQRLMVNYSQLRIPLDRRLRVKDSFEIAPGRIDWYLASPYSTLLLKDIKSQLDRKPILKLGDLKLQVTDNVYVQYPNFSNEMIFTCMSPIVAMCRKERTPTFLLPRDGVEFTNMIRCNLIRKYRQFYNQAPRDSNLELAFDADWLQRTAHRGTKKIFVGGQYVVGAFAPFKLIGSTELIRTAWECGLGDKNSLGFGMIAESRLQPFSKNASECEIGDSLPS